MKRKKPERSTVLVPLVASNLSRLRGLSGLTQMQLGTRARVPQTVVSRVERGEVGTSLLTLEKLAQAMGHHPTELFKRKP